MRAHRLKRLIGSLPFVGTQVRRVYCAVMSNRVYRGMSWSGEYWEKRYARGHTSGAGSYGRLAEFKAEVLNKFVEKADVQSVIEFGCGDGNQLMLAKYPKYLGLDVSPTAVSLCRDKFAADPTKRFELLRDYRGERADLVLSLDVIYHLVEDDVFQEHMRRLFEAAERYVIIYSSNREDDGRTEHVRHREFTTWIAENADGWTGFRHVPNPYPGDGVADCTSFADFHMFVKTASCIIIRD